MSLPTTHARIVSAADTRKCLDTVQLNHLEQTFRAWAAQARGEQRQLARQRILMIFLLIRSTGGRLNEILSLDAARDIDFQYHSVHLRKANDRKATAAGREVQIPEMLSAEIKTMLDQFRGQISPRRIFKADPAHVRRKFYACAEAAGFARETGTPEAIRKARAIELMQSDMPLPVVQTILGHSTPNLAAAYVDFSPEEIHRVERFHIERENQRKTSARNAFYGKIDKITRGDVQALVEIVALDGSRVMAIITGFSLDKLGLNSGALITAEVKAPWVMLYKGDEEPASTAENRFRGKVWRIIKGKVCTEIDVRISESTELCAIITEASRRRLNLKKNDTLWALFSAAAVIIHAD